MTFAPSLTHRLFHNDRMVLVLFGLYGLAGGIVAYLLRSSSGEIISSLYYYMNMPVMLIAAFIEVSFGNPLGFLGSYPAALVPLYAALWSLIGLAVYGVVRMLRLSR